MSDVLLYELKDGAAWLTFNRPEALNAMSPELIAALDGALARAADDPAARVVVLTGAGRAFCAGADLKYFLSLIERARPAEVVAYIRTAYHLINRIEALPKPTIAALNGVTVAGGIEMMLACDLVIAARSARIGDGHANYGLIPGGGSSLRLPRKVGPTRAKYLLYTGELVPAADCLAMGLVNQVVDDDKLIEATTALARKLAAKSPLGLRRMKEMVDDGLQQPLATALKLELAAWEAHAASNDLHEGLAAFNARRQPSYSGT